MSSEEIDDLIDQWHAMPNPPCELHNWLGMSWEEYKEFVEDGTLPTARARQGACQTDSLQ